MQSARTLQPALASPAHRRIIRLALLTLACCVSAAHAAASTSDQATHDQLLTHTRQQRDSGHRMEALAVCETLLQRWPHDAEAQRLRIRLLSELGAANQALQLARELTPSLSPGDMARLEADAAAHQTRWAKAVPADPRQPYAEADRAIALQDDALARHGNRPDLATGIRADRLVSYDQASRSAVAVNDYNAMLRDGGSVPPYAAAAMADALLQQRQPERAIPLYEASIRSHPGAYAENETDPRIGLTYAYLEAGRYRDAAALIDRTAAEEKTWLPAPGSLRPRDNPHKTDADIAAAQVRQQAWLYREAWQRIDALRAQAPANSTLWRELADVERARGWPRRSEDTLTGASALDPEDIAVRLGMIDSWRELNEFDRVEPALQQVEAVIPRDPQAQLARQAWDRQRGWQFDLDHSRGQGGAPNYGDSDHETEATLQSPLLDDRWRLYGITRLASASLPEGKGQRDRLGLGLRGYARGLEAYVQALQGIGGESRRNTLEAGVRWFPSDYWTFVLGWSNTGDQDVPLRASYYGVTAHAFDASVQWRPSELGTVKLSGSQDHFSDNNRRRGWQAQWMQRLHTAPWFTFDGGVEVGGARNTRTDVPYYSPACARWATLNGQLENQLYQRYERNWRQRIDIAAGSYHECRYGTGWMASLRYGQTFAPRGGLSFGWGLGWSSQPYDGRRDKRVTLDLTMHWGE